jgi:hypothetical protein
MFIEPPKEPQLVLGDCRWHFCCKLRLYKLALMGTVVLSRPDTPIHGKKSEHGRDEVKVTCSLFLRHYNRDEIGTNVFN